MKNLKELITSTRTFRRFRQDVPVETETLLELIELARLGGSARNAQPLKYAVCNKPSINERIFPHLGWAGYLTDWSGPAEGERPTAYIICLLDTTISTEAECDLGIATQNILLGATTKGLGGCRIGSISNKLHSALNLPPHLKILLVIALGRPDETVLLEKSEKGGGIKYWRDKDEVHHVPKRSLDEIRVPLEL